MKKLLSLGFHSSHFMNFPLLPVTLSNVVEEYSGEQKCSITEADLKNPNRICNDGLLVSH